MKGSGNRHAVLYSVLHVIPPFFLFKEKGIISVVKIFCCHIIFDTDIFKPANLADMVLFAQRIKLVDGEGKFWQCDINVLSQCILAVIEIECKEIIIFPVG